MHTLQSVCFGQIFHLSNIYSFHVWVSGVSLLCLEGDLLNILLLFGYIEMETI